MLIARMEDLNGRPLLLIGLSRRNVELLKLGRPILRVAENTPVLDQLGIGLSIIYGETEKAILEDFQKNGATFAEPSIEGPPGMQRVERPPPDPPPDAIAEGPGVKGMVFESAGVRFVVNGKLGLMVMDFLRPTKAVEMDLHALVSFIEELQKCLGLLAESQAEHAPRKPGRLVFGPENLMGGDEEPRLGDASGEEYR